jgi:hypothetical protein
MRNIKKILKDEQEELFNRQKYITKEFQDYGYRLAVKLNDLKHKSLYIKLAKEEKRGILGRALSFAIDYPKADNKAKIFMWKLKELRKEFNSNQDSKNQDSKKHESKSETEDLDESGNDEKNFVDADGDKDTADNTQDQSEKPQYGTPQTDSSKHPQSASLKTDSSKRPQSASLKPDSPKHPQSGALKTDSQNPPKKNAKEEDQYTLVENPLENTKSRDKDNNDEEEGSGFGRHRNSRKKSKSKRSKDTKNDNKDIKFEYEETF